MEGESLTLMSFRFQSAIAYKVLFIKRSLSLSLSLSVCVCVCVMQDISKTKKLLSLERVAGGHQKATKSEIRTYIGNTLKI